MTVTIDRLVHCIANLPFLSAVQLADLCRVPGSQYTEFARLLREAVEAGRVECREEASGGFVIPVFRVR